VEPFVRTNLMHFNSPTIKENYYEYGNEEGKVMAQIIDKFNSLNLFSSQQYAMLQTYKLKQWLHQYGQK
jgi:anaerobic ribonucleoside-triphosphate reductase